MCPRQCMYADAVMPAQVPFLGRRPGQACVPGFCAARAPVPAARKHADGAAQHDKSCCCGPGRPHFGGPSPVPAATAAGRTSWAVYGGCQARGGEGAAHRQASIMPEGSRFQLLWTWTPLMVPCSLVIIQGSPRHCEHQTATTHLDVEPSGSNTPAEKSKLALWN